MFLITGLALYRAMYDEVQNQQELIDKIHEILWKGPMSKLIRFLAFFISRSRDPFQRYLQVLGPYNEWFFPCPPWEKVRVDIEDGIGWHQKKCPYVDFFRSEGVVELTRAYYDMDERIVELFLEQIELRRENTMCKGDGWCDFLYYRSITYGNTRFVKKQGISLVHNRFIYTILQPKQSAARQICDVHVDFIAMNRGVVYSSN